MEYLQETVFLGNSLRDWCIALAIVLLCLMGAAVLRRVVLARLRKMASKTDSTLDDFILRMLQKSAMPLLYIYAVYAGVTYLQLSPRADKIMHAAVLAGTVFFAINIVSGFLGYFFSRFTSRSEDEGQVRQARGILILVKVVLWLAGLVFFVDNLGYDITAIVTGLGIGGIAIALAAQTILGDLFSYIVIFFDKPFETGDFIIVGDKLGIVQNIGIKTTRLRTLSGEQLIMSNTDLTNSRVHNFKRMEQRRVVQVLSLSKTTPPAKLRRVPDMIREIVEEVTEARFDRAHFASIGDYSLNIELVYYVLSSDYVLFMDCQQTINLAILERFAEAGVQFAYPVQQLQVSAMGNFALPQKASA